MRFFEPKRLDYVNMPTVARIDGFKVLIYPNDHRPAHVHVIGAGKEAVFDLKCPRGPVELREDYGFSRGHMRRIREHLNLHVTRLCTTWRSIHGET